MTWIVRAALRGSCLSVVLGAATACVPSNQSGTVPVTTGSSSATRTVFTDTVLFRERCVEADSGLTPKIGRCTPRDQGIRIAQPRP